MLPQSRKSARSYPQPKKRIQFLRKNWTSSLIRFSKRFVPENLILFLLVWVFWKYGWTLITVSKDGKRRNQPQFWDTWERNLQVKLGWAVYHFVEVNRVIATILLNFLIELLSHNQIKLKVKLESKYIWTKFYINYIYILLYGIIQSIWK